MADDIVRTTGQMLQVVTPVLSEILTTEEQAEASLRVIRQGNGTLANLSRS